MMSFRGNQLICSNGRFYCFGAEWPVICNVCDVCDVRPFDRVAVITARRTTRFTTSMLNIIKDNLIFNWWSAERRVKMLCLRRLLWCCSQSKHQILSPNATKTLVGIGSKFLRWLSAERPTVRRTNSET